jgi:hypothetical protein
MVQKTEDPPSSNAEHYVGRSRLYGNVAQWTDKRQVKNEFVNLSLKGNTNKQVKSFGIFRHATWWTVIVT